MVVIEDTRPVPADSGSAIAWGAVLAGAATSLALSFVLLGLAAGFGLKLGAVWPGPAWPDAGFTPLLGAALVLIQVLAAALGGYLAGRLRTRWLGVHSHEVHFRDTAHGLLAWAVSVLAGLVLVSAMPAARIAATEAVVDHAVAEQQAVRAAPDPIAAKLVTDREANIAAQAAFFAAFGLLLSAFTASVAAAIGGMRRDEMVAKAE